MLKRFNISQSNPKAFRNPWVLGGFAMLVTVLSMNAFFIYQALKHPPNLVVQNYYDRGEHYETEMTKRLAEEHALGWKANLILPSVLQPNKSQQYHVDFTDANKTKLAMDSVVLYAYRPSDRHDDFIVDMVPTHNKGEYQANVSFHLRGTWDIIVEAHRGKNEFSVAKRICVSKHKTDCVSAPGTYAYDISMGKRH